MTILLIYTKRQINKRISAACLKLSFGLISLVKTLARRSSRAVFIPETPSVDALLPIDINGRLNFNLIFAASTC